MHGKLKKKKSYVYGKEYIISKNIYVSIAYACLNHVRSFCMKYNLTQNKNSGSWVHLNFFYVYKLLLFKN